MAIAPVNGNASNNSGSVSSLALAALTTVTGNDVVIIVVLGSTTSSISSITGSVGTYGTPALQAFKNGTGVRVEIWTIHVTAGGASNVFTVNITGGATSIAAAQENYSGVSSFGNIASASGNDTHPTKNVAIQEGGNWVVGGMGFACQSGDTFSSSFASRQTSIPAATAVGVNLADSTQNVTSGNSVVEVGTISATRQWALALLELRAGGSAESALDYPNTTAASLQTDRNIRYLRILEPVPYALAPSSFSPFPVAVVLKEATSGVAYSETISGHGGTAPYTFALASGSLPTGMSLNSSTGVISGTCSSAATYSFTITATDTNGYVGSQNFSITVLAPTGGGGGSFVFLN